MSFRPGYRLLRLRGLPLGSPISSHVRSLSPSQQPPVITLCRGPCVAHLSAEDFASLTICTQQSAKDTHQHSVKTPWMSERTLLILISPIHLLQQLASQPHGPSQPQWAGWVGRGGGAETCAESKICAL